MTKKGQPPAFPRPATTAEVRKPGFRQRLAEIQKASVQGEAAIGRPGRPSRIGEIVKTPDGPRPLVDLIYDCLRNGSSVQGACASLGVDKTTLEDWHRRGELDLANHLDETPFARFVRGIEKAYGEFEQTLVQRWVDKTPEEWLAARALLRARLPEHYREDARLEVTGADGGPLIPEEMARRIILDAADRLKDS